MRGENTKKQDMKSTDCDERAKVGFNIMRQTRQIGWVDRRNERRKKDGRKKIIYF